MSVLLTFALMLAAAPGPVTPSTQGALGVARWGMTPVEVVAAFKGKARLLEPPVDLKNGSSLGAAIDGYAFEGLSFDVRFIFEGGKLALVSLRTPKKTYVDVDAYARVRDSLTKQWGPPLEETADANFIELRQTRWNRGPDRADLKYIPGVVVIVHYPRAPAP